MSEFFFNLITFQSILVINLDILLTKNQISCFLMKKYVGEEISVKMLNIMKCLKVFIKKIFGKVVFCLKVLIRNHEIDLWRFFILLYSFLLFHNHLNQRQISHTIQVLKILWKWKFNRICETQHMSSYQNSSHMQNIHSPTSP